MKHINRTFTRQIDQTDCGIACLLSILRFHGGNATRERLRELSGTSVQGTSLLGLYQTAQGMGFAAEGLEAEGIHNLAELTTPAILHVLIDQKQQHYVVFYPSPAPSPNGGGSRRGVLIGDPARGLLTLTADELTAIWPSKSLLTLTPTAQFVTDTQTRQTQWQWFRQLIHNDIPLLAVAALLGVVMAGLSLTMSLFSQRLIDDILPNQNTEKLTIGLLLLAVLLLARSGIGYLRNVFLLRQSRDFNTRIAGSFFSDLLQLPKSFFDSRKTGDLVARLNDTRRIQGVISFLTGSVVIDALVVIITASVLFGYAWQIGAVALVSFPLFGALIWRFNSRIIAGQRRVMAAYAQTESSFIDAVSGVGAIKAARQEDFFGRVTQAVYGQFQQKLYDLGLLGNRYSLLSELINVGLLTGLIGLTAFMVMQHTLKLGEMMAVIGMASTLVGSVGKLVTTNIQLQEARVAFERMREFTELEKETTGEKRTEQPATDLPLAPLQALLVENVTFRFPGRAPLLDGISFTVRRGEVVGIVGETGSGKSRLLQLIQQFYLPESGEIFIETETFGTALAGGVKFRWPTGNQPIGGGGLVVCRNPSRFLTEH